MVPCFNTVEGDISAYRGSETIELPANHPLLLHLTAKDIAASPVAVEVVSAEGNQVWKGGGLVDHQQVNARLPKITEKGNYLLRLYAFNK